MMASSTTGSYRSAERRHPRLVRRTAWLRRHSLAVGAVAVALIALVFFFDASVHPVTMAGFYLVPLTLLALAERERLVAAAGVVCGLLTVLVMVWQDTLTASNLFYLLYGGLAGVGLIILAYLIRRLSTISDYATLRAQLSEAGADILTSGGTRDDLDELLQYAVERLGEQLDATAGVLLLLEDGYWQGRAGFGLGVDAREIAAEYGAMALSEEAMRTETTVARDLSAGDPTPGPLTARLRLERVLVVPMRALDREVGVLVYNRAQASGDFDHEQVSLAEYVARYLGVAVDNVRLMLELGAKRRDLELVRDSSLDFAQSLDMTEVLEAVVTRLLDALGMHACDVYEVDQDAGLLRILVSFDDMEFEAEEGAGRELPLELNATSALAVASRRPVLVTSLGDPRLNDAERELLERLGHQTLLSIPLRIRDRVIALVELFDQEPRDLTHDEIELARTICRFAALAVDKARLYDRQRVTAERSDRLARRLQRLQSFAVDLNRRLDRAALQDVLDEVAHAAVDLLHVRAAAVLSGSGEYLAARSLAVAGEASPARLSAVESELLERCREALAAPTDEQMAGGELVTIAVAQADGLLFAPQQASTLVVADKQGGDFDDEDRLLVATLGAQLSASLHNATAYQREHAIAETFQQALLMEPPAIPGIDVGVRYRAATDTARVGGDFYDLVTLGPGRLMVIVGDVCGKSLSAAAQSAVVRYMLRAYAAEGSPGEALSRLNSAVIEQTPDQPFVTLVVAYIDVARHMFEYAVAGHPRPIVLAGHGPFPMPGEGNVPVGIFRGVAYPTNRAILPDDTCVVLYTDGITDARSDGALFGEARLQETVLQHLGLPAQELADTILETVKDYAGGVLADDCAVVTIRLP
jgi:serine phosphatase RsbU (regulator of sigma subunit)/transcriptional regulator with GAF, ATPase, and Fis domain